MSNNDYIKQYREIILNTSKDACLEFLTATELDKVFSGWRSYLPEETLLTSNNIKQTDN